jgi:hypothetical protein
MGSRALRQFGTAALASIFLLASCSSQSPLEKKIAAEVAQEQPLPPGAPMAAAGREILFEADSLNPQQRERLQKLQAKSSEESAGLRREISKNQLVLMKSLVDPKKKDAEIEVLKNRIIALEQKRARHFISTLDEARSILGRRNSDDERFYRALLAEPLDPDFLR